jgi:hypothetical protein
MTDVITDLTVETTLSPFSSQDTKKNIFKQHFSKPNNTIRKKPVLMERTIW